MKKYKHFSFLKNNHSFIDMLTRIKNAINIKSRNVLVIKSNLTKEIAKILKQEGFIESFEETGQQYLINDKKIKKFILIRLKYKGIRQDPYITNIKRISKPGLRVYSKSQNIPKVLEGIGISVFAKNLLKINKLNSLNYNSLI